MSDRADGFVKIYRKFFDHFLWTEQRELSKAEAWIWIIKEARYKTGKSKKFIGTNLIEWKRGELPASLRFLQNAWNWGSTTKVRNFLELLEKEDMIKTRKTQGQNVLTVCNYSTYNPIEDSEKHSKNTEKTQTEHTGNTPGTQNSKKGNKGKKGKEERGARSKTPPGKRSLSGFEEYRKQELDLLDVEDWMKDNDIKIDGDEFEYEIARFRDKFSGKRYKDWVATFRNYLRSRYLDTEHFDYKTQNNDTENKGLHSKGSEGEYDRDSIEEFENAVN